ncbi:MAG: ATP-binding cassette domain-containing protein [Candidatus Latescibacteria bacterium]|nr:ATP-binding cassette domain-containing protein [Candidatus Latescibacterota bacterium]
MIEVEHLTKRYGPVAAVDDISFQVGRGEILGFLGPNGAGKTTTMRILTCYMPATSGVAKVAGYDVFAESLEVRRRIGYMPEQPPLYRDMSVRSFLTFASKIKGVEKARVRSRVDEVMGRCGVDDVADRLIGKLSKGYRQRVGLAQALVHNPDVLILDEPTAGLDPNQIREVRALIRSLAGDHTIILSTHILPEVSVTCERVVIINRGRIVAVDSPGNLTARLKGSERVFMEVAGGFEAAAAVVREVEGVTDVFRDEGTPEDGRVRLFVESPVGIDVRARVAARIVQQGIGLLEMRRIEMSLEDIFAELTTSEEEGVNA